MSEASNDLIRSATLAPPPLLTAYPGMIPRTFVDAIHADL